MSLSAFRIEDPKTPIRALMADLFATRDRVDRILNRVSYLTTPPHTVVLILRK